MPKPSKESRSGGQRKRDLTPEEQQARESERLGGRKAVLRGQPRIRPRQKSGEVPPKGDPKPKRK